MTIVELNIGGIHITRSAPSRAVVIRSWRRNFREMGRNVKNTPWSAHLRSRPVAERPAA